MTEKPEERTEGLITLQEWAERCGYSYNYVLNIMPRHYPDFPEPRVRRKGDVGRGGGSGNNLYDPAELEKFRPRRPDPVELPDEDLVKQVTLGGFAALIGVASKSVTQIKDDRPDTLPPTVDGQRQWYWGARYHVRDLLLMWNSRPGRGTGSDKRRPPLPWQRTGTEPGH
ncbi:hypothetical protein NI17_024120 (plasmid) [Thermobifida halotolerans]|uniref:Uncharacterized protein n=1 Tax=Thermobifida halotolerans TaxID=483545 RepID=A0A399FVI0_9ACTN|nr:hypothetical protein [Thermobifida halotolerans]UOE22254.1 hypothetical protein NI17_024120 [Thermobifida halotolerans]